MEELLRFLALASLILGTLLISHIGGSVPGYASQPQHYSNYTVSELLETLPLDQHVSLSGTVSKVR